jgi:hypothetical protein
MLQSPAEAAAASLHALMQTPDVQQLLQQPSSAATAQLRGLVGQLHILHNSLELDRAAAAAAQATAETGRMLAGVLRRQAVHNVAIRLAWTQQQPQHLELALLQQQMSASVRRMAPSAAVLWLLSALCLALLADAFSRVCSSPPEGCSVAALAAAMLRQVQQSGGLPVLLYKAWLQ